MDFDLFNKAFLDIINKSDIDREVIIENSDWFKRNYTYLDYESKVAYDLSIWFSLFYLWGMTYKNTLESLDRLDSFIKFDSDYMSSKYSRVERVVRIFLQENKELFKLLNSYWIEYLVIKK